MLDFQMSETCNVSNHRHIVLSTGLEMDTPSPAPAKKTPTAPQLGDKYNIKPPVLKRPRHVDTVLTGHFSHDLCEHSAI